ncbi:hypothetical protein Poli38472_008975 [Pythium oligandrum]|uniref:DNA/RNA-binding protein Kin17 WH-like domain-containing protein n=1 Tax=Pythium oligandrum TaxID=41045 RepID=A0A8K1CM18_PYTOL|nr:hypothetical protein Poli38472_008975 [Pythium oligandrum]|eukprot:TMW64808.1 hypothetical protein Poli38472_008975 [Pythium oligandrum]
MALPTPLATPPGMMTGEPHDADVHSLLEVTQQPPETWYKDQFGRKATFDVQVQRVSRGCGGCREQRHLNVQLLYESGKVVENQNILRVASGLCLNKDDVSVLAIRIMEVSKNHQNQKFRLQISLPGCAHKAVPSTGAAAITNAVLVLSKKNKRPVKAEGEDSEAKSVKSKKSKHSPTHGHDSSSPQNSAYSTPTSKTLLRTAPAFEGFTDSMDVESAWASESVRFQRPTEGLCLWANAAFNFLRRLQWQHRCSPESPDQMSGMIENTVYMCPVCNAQYGMVPAHRQECDLALLLEQTGLVDEEMAPPQPQRTHQGSNSIPVPKHPTTKKLLFDGEGDDQDSVNMNGWRLSPLAHGKSYTMNGGGRISNQPPAFGTASVDLLAKNLNLESWEGYSSLSKIMFSMEADGRQPRETTLNLMAPSGKGGSNASVASSFGSGLLSFAGSSPAKSSQQTTLGISSLISGVKEMSPETVAFLQEQDAELTGDASLLRSLSRVSLTDFMPDGSNEASNGAEELRANVAALSAVMADEVKTQTAESAVMTIAAADFRHCGCPAFDSTNSLTGFYFVSESEGSTQLRFMPNFYPLPPQMLQELEKDVATWRLRSDILHSRRSKDANALDQLKELVVAALLRRGAPFTELNRITNKSSMGKHEFLTAKAIGNRMKAKGLQKLRWYCQVCQKQCRDENGFKCHTTSESHQRQMLVVASNPDKFLSGYSEMFEKDFLENLRRRHGTKRMHANIVYNEYIADKEHIHMNATQWTTLNGFVQYLGRTGKCTVDETEKGWYVQYIDRDPRKIARQEELEKKKQAELDHEERNRAFIERQLKMTRERMDDESLEQRPTKLQRREGDEGKIQITLGGSRSGTTSQTSGKLSSLNVFGGGENDDASAAPTKKSGRAVDAIMEAEEKRKREQEQRRVQEEDLRAKKHENWVTTGIVVKVMNKRVGDGKYYKQKGEIVQVKDRFGAKVEMLDSGDILQLDQDDLETVIPKVGRRVKIVNGAGRGNVATLLSISVDDFCASVRIESGSRRGDVLKRVEYEDICRVIEEEPSEKR